MNRGYISVFVHADRRPDIAERFRTGNWPVMGLLLPDSHPMISGADAEDSIGKPILIGATDPKGLKFLLDEGLVYWSRYRNVLFGDAYEWAETSDPADPVPGPLTREVVDGVVAWMQANFDAESGGFGAAPKYVVSGLEELGRLRAMRGDRVVGEMARRTTEGILASPLRDRRDGGVHRMAAAPGWDSLQYEKLLDRNAIWLRELAVAIEDGGGEELRRAARETARFLLEVLGRPEGGFYFAQAADFRSTDGGGYWRGETEEAPFIDRLVLSGSNALAGAALLRAGWALDDSSLREAGARALDFVLEHGVVRGRGARHIAEGQDDGLRFLETQAEVAFGLVEGYQATGRREYLAAAADVATFAVRNLLAPDETALRDPRRPLGPNLTLARAMLRIAVLSGDSQLRGHAEGILTTWAGSLAGFGRAGIEGALAVEEALNLPVVVRIPPDAPGMRREALRAGPWVLVETLQDSKGEPEASVVYGDRREIVREPARVRAAVETLRAGGS